MNNRLILTAVARSNLSGGIASGLTTRTRSMLPARTSRYTLRVNILAVHQVRCIATPSIYNDACNGKLDDASLTKYLNAGENINEKNTESGHTPLMCAARKGRLKAVKCLLKRGADVTLRSESGETALWWAAAGATNKTRLEIVKLILRADPKPDLDAAPNYPTKSPGYTPVMAAIVETNDDKVVSLLVDSGANLELKNWAGKTAKDLATDRKDSQPKLLKALQNYRERQMDRIPIVERVGKFIRHCVHAFGKLTSDSNKFNSELKFSGSSDESLPESLQSPKNVEELKKEMLAYVKETGLDKFFPQGSPLLQKLAEGIEKFQKSDHPLNKPENLHGLIKLSLYQTIVFCDDSFSMTWPIVEGAGIIRKDAQNVVVERITKISSLLLPDDGGIYLHFLNHKHDHDWGKLNADQVIEKMNSVKPRGATLIGTKLHQKVLQPYIYNKLSGSEGLDRPYLISIITDGAPTGGHGGEARDHFRNTIGGCIDKLQEKYYGDKVVAFVVVQIGDDPDAKDFLSELSKSQDLGPSVYVCKEQPDKHFDESNKNYEDLDRYLFEILTAPLIAKG